MRTKWKTHSEVPAFCLARCGTVSTSNENFGIEKLFKTSGFSSWRIMAFCLHKLVNVACFMKYLLLISITNIDCPNRCFASCNKIFRMLKQILFSGYICNYFFFSFDNIDFNFLFHTMRYSLLCFGKTSSNLVVLLEDIFQNFVHF